MENLENMVQINCITHQSEYIKYIYLKHKNDQQILACDECYAQQNQENQQNEHFFLPIRLIKNLEIDQYQKGKLEQIGNIAEDPSTSDTKTHFEGDLQNSDHLKHDNNNYQTQNIQNQIDIDMIEKIQNGKCNHEKNENCAKEILKNKKKAQELYQILSTIQKDQGELDKSLQKIKKILNKISKKCKQISLNPEQNKNNINDSATKVENHLNSNVNISSSEYNTDTKVEQFLGSDDLQTQNENTLSPKFKEQNELEKTFNNDYWDDYDDDQINKKFKTGQDSYLQLSQNKSINDQENNNNNIQQKPKKPRKPRTKNPNNANKIQQNQVQKDPNSNIKLGAKKPGRKSKKQKELEQQQQQQQQQLIDMNYQNSFDQDMRSNNINNSKTDMISDMQEFPYYNANDDNFQDPVFNDLNQFDNVFQNQNNLSNMNLNQQNQNNNHNNYIDNDDDICSNYLVSNIYNDNNDANQFQQSFQSECDKQQQANNNNIQMQEVLDEVYNKEDDRIYSQVDDMIQYSDSKNFKYGGIEDQELILENNDYFQQNNQNNNSNNNNRNNENNNNMIQEEKKQKKKRQSSQTSKKQSQSSKKKQNKNSNNGNNNSTNNEKENEDNQQQQQQQQQQFQNQYDLDSAKVDEMIEKGNFDINIKNEQQDDDDEEGIYDEYHNLSSGNEEDDEVMHEGEEFESSQKDGIQKKSKSKKNKNGEYYEGNNSQKSWDFQISHEIKQEIQSALENLPKKRQVKRAKNILINDHEKKVHEEMEIYLKQCPQKIPDLIQCVLQYLKTAVNAKAYKKEDLCQLISVIVHQYYIINVENPKINIQTFAALRNYIKRVVLSKLVVPKKSQDVKAKRWSNEEVEQLMKYLGESVTYFEIARRLGRPYSGIVQQINKQRKKNK